MFGFLLADCRRGFGGEGVFLQDPFPSVLVSYTGLQGYPINRCNWYLNYCFTTGFAVHAVICRLVVWDKMAKAGERLRRRDRKIFFDFPGNSWSTAGRYAAKVYLRQRPGRPAVFDAAEEGKTVRTK